MDTCTVETGLLKKKPCGGPSIARCANCEQPLCAKHAVAQLTATGRKTGKFMCKDCHAAWQEYEKNAAPVQEKKPAAAEAKPAAPAAAAAKPAAPAAAKAAAPAAKAAEEKKDDSAPLEFTPSKPPADKK